MWQGREHRRDRAGPQFDTSASLACLGTGFFRTRIAGSAFGSATDGRKQRTPNHEQLLCAWLGQLKLEEHPTLLEDGSLRVWASRLTCRVLSDFQSIACIEEGEELARRVGPCIADLSGDRELAESFVEIDIMQLRRVEATAAVPPVGTMPASQQPPWRAGAGARGGGGGVCGIAHLTLHAFGDLHSYFS